MNIIVNKINKNLSSNFKDYHGLYFYGSRSNSTNLDDSDYDLVLMFDFSNYKKKLEIAGIIGKIEYENNVFIDIKIMTLEGLQSVENISKNINPAFINQAIGNGIFYDRK